MIIRKLTAGLLVLALLAGFRSAEAASAAGVPAADGEASVRDVLLLYDSLALGTPLEGNIEALEAMLSAYGARVTLVRQDAYEAGEMDAYDYVIGVSNESNAEQEQEQASGAVTHDLEGYKGSYLHIGPALPASVQQQLGIQTEELPEGWMDLAIGDYKQAAITVGRMSAVVQSAGMTTYGLWSAQGTAAGGKSTSGGTPFAVWDGGRYGYIPYYATGNLSELAVSYLLHDWLGATGNAQTYLLLKEVYPFSDLELLMDAADELYEAGLPFIVSVRPVFDNLDYPAMKRYLEALKYVQSRNGSILVNAPVVAGEMEREENVLQRQMAAFIDALIEYGIAPLGIGAELYWSYDKLYTEQGMAFFDSAVLYPNEKVMAGEPVAVSKPFSSSLYSVSLPLWSELQQKQEAKHPFPAGIAVTVDFTDDSEELARMLEQIKSGWTLFADYKQLFHQTATDGHQAASAAGALKIDGQDVPLDEHLAAVSSDYQYAQEAKQSLTKLFGVQNRIFIIIIIGSLMVFGVLMAIGFRLYRRKYMK